MAYGLGRSILHGFFNGFGRDVAAYENGECISFRFESGERFSRATLTGRSDGNFHFERANLELDIPQDFFMRESLHDARKVCPLGAIRKALRSTWEKQSAGERARRELDEGLEDLHGREQ